MDLLYIKHSNITLKLLLGFLLFLSSFVSFSQKSIELSGFIYDENKIPISDANIFLAATLEGAISDANGFFKIQTNASSGTLIITAIGYYETRVNFNSEQRLSFKIYLDKEITSLDEVLIKSTNSFTVQSGYGEQKSKIESLQTPGAQGDTFKSLQNLEGVSKIDDNASIFVRGGNFDETATIIDGAYLFNPFKFTSPNGGFFGTISPFVTQKSYFSNGGFSSRYGNAISGLVVLESEDLIDTQVVELTLSLSNASLKYTTPIIKDKLSISFFGNYIDTQGLFLINEPLIGFREAPSSGDFNVLANYKISKNLKFKLHYLQNGDSGITESQNFESANTFFNTDNSFKFVNLSSKFRIKKIKGAFNVSYSEFDGETAIFSESLDNSFTKSNINDNKVFQANLRSQFKLLRNLKSSLGIGYVDIDEDTKSNFFFSQFAENRSLETTTGTSDTIDYNSSRLFAFNDFIFDYGKHQILLGGRWEKDSQSDNTIFNIRGNYNWEFLKNYSANIAIGQYSQYADPDFYALNTGNPLLGSVSATHYILGLGRVTSKNAIRFNAFYKDYTKLVINDPTLNFSNEGEGFAQGFDISYSQTLKKHTFKVSSSYLDAKRKWLNAPLLSSPRFDITWNFNALWNFEMSKHFFFAMNYRYATGKPFVSGPNIEDFNSQRVPHFSSLDTSFNYKFFGKSPSPVVFFVTVNNILDRKNITDIRFNDDFSQKREINTSLARNIFFGININFIIP